MIRMELPTILIYGPQDTDIVRGKHEGELVCYADSIEEIMGSIGNIVRDNFESGTLINVKYTKEYPYSIIHGNCERTIAQYIVLLEPRYTEDEND
jgi:hypothetical protein